MWVKRKGDFGLIDSKIVTRDFIVAEGSTSSFSFLWENQNPFGRSVTVPIIYILKIHRNHPLTILSAGTSHVYLYPTKELRSNKLRMPAEVYRNKMDHDLTAFMLVPFDVQFEEHIGGWEKSPIHKTFIQNERSSPPGEIMSSQQDSYLLYCEHGINIGSNDHIGKISEVMPSQVLDHFFCWLKESKKIESHEKTFKRKVEGNIEIPLDNVRNLTFDIATKLEKRYKTRLMFDDYKDSWKYKRNQSH
ncbi:MAG: hypothetical protein ABIB79_04685 [archaeon]